jgi:hypothetical protein
MKYKIHEKYEGEEFWTRSEAPQGYRNARTCDNCGKMSIASMGPDGIKMLCNEVTEYTGLYDTGVPRIYSRQAFYTDPKGTCDEHKFKHEMEEEEE